VRPRVGGGGDSGGDDFCSRPHIIDS